MEELKLRLATPTDSEKILILRKNSESSSFQLSTNNKELDNIQKEIRNSENNEGIYVIENTNNDIIAVCSFYFAFPRNGFTFLRLDFLYEISHELNLLVLQKISELCFYKLNYNKINIKLRITQTNQMDLLLSFGFKHEVLSKQHYFINNHYEDIYQFGLTKSDFLMNFKKEKKILKQNLNIQTSENKDHTLITNVSPHKQILKGEKIDLVPFTEEDLKDICEQSFYSDEQNFSSIGAAVPLTKEYLDKLVKNLNDFYFLKSDISLAIKEKNKKIIGILTFESIDLKNNNLTLGLSIYDSKNRGKGFGGEAITLATDFAFLELNIHRVYLGCFAFNEKAALLYEHLGYKFEGVNRCFIYRNGNYYDEIVFGICKKEWLLHRGFLV